MIREGGGKRGGRGQCVAVFKKSLSKFLICTRNIDNIFFLQSSFIIRIFFCFVSLFLVVLYKNFVYMHFVFVEGRNNKTTFAVYNMLEGYCYIIFIILIAREREKKNSPLKKWRDHCYYSPLNSPKFAAYSSCFSSKSSEYQRIDVICTKKGIVK